MPKHARPTVARSSAGRVAFLAKSDSFRLNAEGPGVHGGHSSAAEAGWEWAQSAGRSGSRYGWRMKVTRARENVFALTLTGQELSALVAGARMALDIMERDPHAPREAVELLRGVVGDYDDALARLKAPDGRPGRPSG
jgi:hypothetical protein